MPATLTRDRARDSETHPSPSYKVRRSEPTDDFELKPEDAREVFLSHGLEAHEALSFSIRNSVISYTATRDGVPFLAFGVNAQSIISSFGVIWMLSDDTIRTIPIRFIKECYVHLDCFLSIYPVLWNYVHEANKTSLKWVKLLGAEIEEARPYGLHNAMFHKFSFCRSKVKR